MTPQQQLDARIVEVAGWRGQLMAHLSKLITETAPELELQWKWGTAIWAQDKTLVVGLGVFKEHVKINFMQGVALPDPVGLFNAGLDAKASRGIDIHQGESIDEAALRALIRAAV